MSQGGQAHHHLLQFPFPLLIKTKARPIASASHLNTSPFQTVQVSALRHVQAAIWHGPPRAIQHGRATQAVAYFFFPCVLSFEQLKLLCGEDKDFRDLFKEWQKPPKGEFLVQEGYFMKGTQLCVPDYSTRKLLIRKVHERSLASHFGENKNLIMLKEHYLWPCMDKDVQDVMKRYVI